MLGNIDRSLLYLVNQTMARSLVFDVFFVGMGDVALWGIIVTIVLACLACKGGRKGRVVALLAIVCFVFTNVTNNNFLRPFFGRLRPSHALRGLWLPLGQGGLYGFPSGHAACAFSLAVLFSFFYPRRARLCFILAALISFSRVCSGKHYPSDILAGAIYGTLVAGVFIYLGTKWLQRWPDEPSAGAQQTAEPTGQEGTEEQDAPTSPKTTGMPDR